MTNKEAIKYLQQLYTNGGHCWLDEQRIEAIGMAVKALQEEPVSEDLEEASNNYVLNVRKGYPRVMDETDRYICNAFKAGAQWQKQQLMANAVDGKIYETQARSKLKAATTGKLSPLDYNVGDKVKVVVIKED